MSEQEYNLRLTRAPNGGWIISEENEPPRMHTVVAAYSNKSHMLTGLSDMIDNIGGKDD